MKTLEEMDLAQPRTLDEAVGLLASESTRGRLLAGGTDLMVQWASGTAPVPGRAISLAAIDALKHIHDTGPALEIGALVTHAQLRASDAVHRHLPALAEAASLVGGVQIQNRGTIGGNIANASPAGDLAPALLITDGSVVTVSRAGERVIPLSAFFRGYRTIDLRPDEALARFVLPKKPPEAREGFRKLGPRAMQAISKVMGAYRAEARDGTLHSVALAFGSVAATALRLTEVERWLVGKKLTPDVIAEAERRASAMVKPIDDIRSTAEYRQWVTGRLVRGFLEVCV